MEVLAEPAKMAYLVQSGDTWMSSLILFLSQEILPKDRAETRRIQRKSARYTLRESELYKRSYLDPWLRCISTEEGHRILQEIHDGLCGAHLGYRMLVKKVLLLGYF